ncbi:unnamed protein product [Phytomonas sp. Hart1]|nr:unnamed protein product [Phytomonas sp. Hart1]|eukprot:CCW69542.1 unnamed protein product [Phytomonas sp. isolate Hart1]
MNCVPLEGALQAAMASSSGSESERKKSSLIATEKKMSSLELSGCNYYEQYLSLVGATMEGALSGCVDNLADRAKCQCPFKCSSGSVEEGGNPDKAVFLQESNQLQCVTNVYDMKTATACIEPNSHLACPQLCDRAHTQKEHITSTLMHEDVHSNCNTRVNVQGNHANVSLSGSSNFQPLPSSLRMQTLAITSYENDAVSTLLLHPSIPAWQDANLRTAFEKQAVTVKLQFERVRLIMYYFFSCYKLLFRRLATPERINIFRRLVTVFGVPENDILENLAARCVIRHIKQHEEARALLEMQSHGERDKQRAMLKRQD